jgi:hypothetical protein
MIRGISAKTDAHVHEMIPSKNGKAMECFPAGAIAQAWLSEYSQQLTWDDLKEWLGAHPRLSTKKR